MAKALEKGYVYDKGGLNFTLIDPNYKCIGKVYYVKARCNICNKNVQLFRGEWANNCIKICPSCQKLAEKEGGSTAKENDNKQVFWVKTPRIIKDIDRDRVDKSSSQPGHMMSKRSASLLSPEIKKDDIKTKSSIGQKVNVGIIGGVGDKPEKRSSTEGPFKIPGWRFVQSQLRQSGNYEYIYSCETCGSTLIKSFAMWSKFDGRCRYCESIKNNRSVPLNKMDWIGYTNKCRMVTKVFDGDNGIRMATLKCLLCGKEEDIALASVIAGIAPVCEDCSRKKLTIYCPACGKTHLKNTLASLYSGINSDIVCTEGLKEHLIPKGELVRENDYRVKIQYIQSKYKGKLRLKDHIEGNGNKAELFVFDTGYTGTDGQQYINCMCTTHNKLMVLTEDEMQNYQHEFCMNPRMVYYNSKAALK